MSIEGYDRNENKYECFGSNNSCDIEDMFTVEHFQPMVATTDPQARDRKYTSPSKIEGKSCGNCASFQGSAGAASGGCPLFAGYKVSSKAICSAWVKKR